MYFFIILFYWLCAEEKPKSDGLYFVSHKCLSVAGRSHCGSFAVCDVSHASYQGVKATWLMGMGKGTELNSISVEETKRTRSYLPLNDVKTFGEYRCTVSWNNAGSATFKTLLEGKLQT